MRIIRSLHPRKNSRGFLSRIRPAAVDSWQSHQLNCNVSTRSGRKKQFRTRSKLLIRSLAILCLMVSVPVLAKLGYDHIFHESEEFKLDRLVILTDGDLAESAIAEAGGVSAGMDLMELDLEEVRSRLEDLPNVAEAEVTRELPDRLEIRVKELVPVAWLSCPPQGIRPMNTERGFLLDAEGNVFRCLELHDGMKALPVIEALKIARPAEGTILQSESIRKAIELITRSDTFFEGLGLEVAEVRIVTEWSLDCVYRDGMIASFAMNDIERGLLDLNHIVRKMRLRSMQLETVNLVVTKNIPVTFAAGVDASVLEADDAETEEIAGQESEPAEREEERKHLRSILKGG